MSSTMDRAIPDYSEQAAEELRFAAADWRDLSKRVIAKLDDKAALAELLHLTEQVQRTVHLLGYPGVKFGLSEVSELIRHWQTTPAVDQKEAALVLLQIAQELDGTLSLPTAHAKRMSALGWLTVIDNCRACRFAPSLSKDVVAAAGIALPIKSTKPMPARSDFDDFLTAVRGVHRLFAQQLVVWFRQPDSPTHLQETANTFIRLANVCAHPSRVSMLDPLFRSAGVVLLSVAADPSYSSVAMQRMFGRLERYLAKFGRMEFDELAKLRNWVPDDILRQLLFYVARFSQDGEHARKLHREFGLHVLAVTSEGVNSKRPINAKLHEYVVQQCKSELNELQVWLSQAATDPKHRQAKKLLTHLDEQSVAFSLLGFEELQARIESVKAAAQKMTSPATESDKLRLAELIIRADEALSSNSYRAESQKPAVGMSVNSVDDVASRLRQLSRQNDSDQFRTKAAVACLRAVQADLRTTENDVLDVLNGTPELYASAEQIAHRLYSAANAVKVLPMPEIVPLLNGFADAVRMQISPDSTEPFKNQCAELLVSLDLYLDSVISNSPSQTALLQHAVSALRAVQGDDVTSPSDIETDSGEELHFANSDAAISNSDDDAVADEEPQGEAKASTDAVLESYFSANQAVGPWVSARSSDRQPVDAALLVLRDTSARANLSELATLVSHCHRFLQRSPLPADARDLVRETLSVVPQMLHAEPGVDESVRGLEELQIRLLPEDANAVTALFVRDDVNEQSTRNDSFDQNDDVLDSTLHNVFVRECAAHISTLRKAIAVARADIPLAKLPSDNMLRALHTLSGCAQTVDASAIVAIVQPLQKSALALQRCADEFNEEETNYIEQLANAMDARLEVFGTDDDVTASVVETEQQLPKFVASVLERCQPAEPSISNTYSERAENESLGVMHTASDTDDSNPQSVSSWMIAKSNRIEHSEAGLSSIFRSEADDLMLRLRSHASVLLRVKESGERNNKHAEEARQGALRVLHTLKGSARMAGHHAMADAAHDVESEVNPIADTLEFGEALRQRLPMLQAALQENTLIGNDSAAAEDAFDDGTSTLTDHAGETAEHFSDELAHSSTGLADSRAAELGSGRKPENTSVNTTENTSDDESVSKPYSSPQGITESTTEVTTEGVTEGITKGTTSGTTESTKEGSTEGKAEGTTSGATEGTSEGSSEDNFTAKSESRFASAPAFSKESLSDSPPRLDAERAASSSQSVDAVLSDLLSTGTRLVSRQASVDERIALLRGHIRDVQASADRLQRLASNNPAFDSVAARELVADFQVARRHLEKSVQELEHAHGLASHAGTAVHRALVQAQLRTVDSLLPRLEATLNDALTVCNREGSLLLTGGDLPVAEKVLKSLAPLLEQLIRNGVAHGIDSAAVRQAERKPTDGEIAIAVRVDGTDLLIDFSDDGDGIDEAELNQQRREQGLPPVRNAHHLREIVCSPGFSTLADATPVAGRGQGLAMVLDGVEALGGTLDLINEPGEGLTVRLRIPQPMVVAQSLVFGDNRGLHAIPVSHVVSVVEWDGEIQQINHQGQLWTLCTVEELIGVPSVSITAERCALVKVGSEHFAIPVTNLQGYKELIVQPLGAQIQSLDRYVGGAVLSDGRQALILNLNRLVHMRKAIQQAGQPGHGDSATVEPLIALIADDSVTMRVAGERLLQRLGFQVHSARDGLEALDFLKRSLPSVLLLDIEMPGADGFDVIRHVRSELVAAQVPVIMISTRRGPQERERARSLGVKHLIHKPYTETQLREALEEVGLLVVSEMGN